MVSPDVEDQLISDPIGSAHLSVNETSHDLVGQIVTMEEDQVSIIYFCREIQDCIETIKLKSAEYLHQILSRFIAKKWRLNPCNLIRACYNYSGNQDVHAKADEMLNLIIKNNYFGGFSLKYMLYFKSKRVKPIERVKFEKSYQDIKKTDSSEYPAVTQAASSHLLSVESKTNVTRF